MSLAVCHSSTHIRVARLDKRLAAELVRDDRRWVAFGSSHDLRLSTSQIGVEQVMKWVSEWVSELFTSISSIKHCIPPFPTNRKRDHRKAQQLHYRYVPLLYFVASTAILTKNPSILTKHQKWIWTLALLVRSPQSKLFRDYHWFRSDDKRPLHLFIKFSVSFVVWWRCTDPPQPSVPGPEVLINMGSGVSRQTRPWEKYHSSGGGFVGDWPRDVVCCVCEWLVFTL
jgi:hypothetical protein